MLDWCWHKDPNTFSLFVHLILAANIKPKKWKDIVVERGQIVTSISKLSELTGLTLKQTRTALNHLKGTKEVAIKTTPKYSIITINNYEKFQQGSKYSANKGHSEGKVRANKGQQLKNSKNVRKKERESIPSFSDVEQFVRTENLNVDAKKFFDYNEKRKWQITDKPIDDWKSLVRTWSKNEHKTYASGAYDGVPTISREEFLRLKKEAEENDEWD
nr:MAG TPA: replisome organizer [Caudoviricetes sp.]